METERGDLGSAECLADAMMFMNLDSLSEIKNGNLPDWLLVEVLVRLPVKLVFKLKIVSKQWSSVISDPLFVRTYVSRASLSLQLRPWCIVANYLNTERDERLVDLYSPDLECPYFYVLPCLNTPHMPASTVLAVSNGLVLYVLFGPMVSYSESAFRQIVSYNICNPVTRKWITLPLPSCRYGNASWGFLTRVENGILENYRVVGLGLAVGCRREVEVFVPEIGRWKKFDVYTDSPMNVVEEKVPFELNGILHWLTRQNEIVAYDPYGNLSELCFIALPSDKDLMMHDSTTYYTLCDVRHGQLRYFKMLKAYASQYLFSDLVVWVLTDYSSGKWHLQHEIKFEDILKDAIFLGLDVVLYPICIHAFDPDTILFGHDENVVSCNFRTGKSIAHAPVDDWFMWRYTFLLVAPPWPLSIPPLPALARID